MSSTLVIEDLSQLTNDEIRDGVFDAFAQLTIWLLRDGRTHLRFLDNLDEWANALLRVAADPYGVGTLVQILRHIALVTDDLQLDVFRAKRRERAPEVERPAMTIATPPMRRRGAVGETQGRVER